MPNKTYSILINEYRFEFNREYSIYFDSKALEKWFLDLLAYRCAICNPIVPFSATNERTLLRTDIQDYFNANSLDKHLCDEHNKRICPICAKGEQMFPGELRVYSNQVLFLSFVQLVGVAGASERNPSRCESAYACGKGLLFM